MGVSPQAQPDRACARPGWKIRELRRPMKRSGATGRLKAIAGHDFQRVLAQCRTIGRDQYVAVALSQGESVNEQVFEIMLDLKRLSARRTRKSRRIKNNYVKFLTFAHQTRQHCPDIIRDKAMLDCWKAVQGKVRASSRQRLFGKINVQGSG